MGFISIRYKPDNSDFRKLMMSDQTQDLANQGASFGALAARAYAKGERLFAEYIASIRHEEGPPMVLGGNPRRTARVLADYPFVEFGSGLRRRREQGGNSPAYRILGRTGARVGNPPDGESGAR